MGESTFFGVPAHPLFVHIPVLGIPLTFLALILFAVLPSKRPTLFWITGVLTVVVTIATIFAAGSGEQLQRMLPPEDQHAAILERHTHLGDQTQSIMIVFAIVTILFLALYWFTHMRPATADGSSSSTPSTTSTFRLALLTLGVAAVLLGGFATTWDVRTGHAGAKSAWGHVASDK